MSFQSSSSSSRSQSLVQKQLREDWGNREYIEIVAGSIKKISDFLNSFDASCRTKLAALSEKLGKLEKKIECLEARVTRNETLN